MSAFSGWADSRLASLFVAAEALAKTLPDGSTEQGCVLDAMNALEMADVWAEKRRQESLRHCDDCGFSTAETDMAVCPDPVCRGSVG